MGESIPPLFKYVPPARVDILETLRIAFTPPLRFSDPFEYSPKFARIPKPDAWQMAQPTAKELQILKQAMPKRKEIREWRRKFAKRIRSEVPGEMQDGLPSQVSRLGGVLCLTTVKDSLLMWAHYASSHRGFVMEFDPQVLQQLNRICPITYSIERPMCEVLKPENAVPHRWFLVKSKEWEYEKEYRIIREFRDCEAECRNGETVYLCPLPKNAVKAIYLGVRMEKKECERIMAIARPRGISIFQARLSRSNFGLEFLDFPVEGGVGFQPLT
jgi:hypothetical protein